LILVGFLQTSVYANSITILIEAKAKLDQAGTGSGPIFNRRATDSGISASKAMAESCTSE
jgi:hypothetical protein